MQDKRTRRRLLADMLFLGGALLGAAALTRPEPFFEQLLEDQDKRPVTKPSDPVTVTKAYPSDSDMDFVDCTEAYPSDRDIDYTQAYPSDSDKDCRLLDSEVRIQPGPTSESRPFWKAIGSR